MTRRLHEEIKRTLVHVGVFSFFFNVIMFVSPIYMLQIYNRVLPARSEEMLLWLSGVVVVMFMFMTVIDAARTLMLIKLSHRLDAHIGENVFIRSLKDAMAQNDLRGSWAIKDLDQVRSLVANPVLLAFFDLMWLPLFIVAILLVHPLLALVAIGGGGILFLLTYLNHSHVKEHVELARQHSIGAWGLADSVVSKARTVRPLGMSGALVARWNRIRDDLAEAQLAAGQWSSIFGSASKAMRLLIQSAALGVGAWLTLNETMSAGAIIAVSVLLGRALAPLEVSINAWREVVKARGAYLRLRDLLNAPEPQQITVGAESFSGQLEVDHLSKKIEGSDILRDVQFEIEPGQVVAVVGPSGAGKTTLIRHLVGAAKGDVGAVRADGVDVALLSDDILGRLIGYVPQEIDLFAGTIAENIARFGEADPRAVVAAAELAGIHDMILRLPSGYETQVGREGQNLSGGQRQRIAVARAVYGDPKIVIMDEPTAHLDERGESALAEMVARLRRAQITVIVVSHRIGLIHMADLLLVMDARRRYRFGRPQELFARNLRPVSNLRTA